MTLRERPARRAPTPATKEESEETSELAYESLASPTPLRGQSRRVLPWETAGESSNREDRARRYENRASSAPTRGGDPSRRRFSRYVPERSGGAEDLLEEE